MHNPLVADLLAIAEQLLATAQERAGSSTLRQAFLRRSISTAYYALFHALCYVAASQLVGWSRTDELEPIYRSLDHGLTRKVLNSPGAAMSSMDFPRIAATFADLQQIRHEADYSPPGRLFGASRPFSIAETRTWIDEARTAVALIDGMSEAIQRRLAIQLIARPRRA